MSVDARKRRKWQGGGRQKRKKTKEERRKQTDSPRWLGGCSSILGVLAFIRALLLAWEVFCKPLFSFSQLMAY